MGLFSSGPRINDPYGTQGGQSVQRQAAAHRSSGGVNEKQVKKILAMRAKYDRGSASAADLLKVVKESKGSEINAAMDDYGKGTRSWSQIKDD